MPNFLHVILKIVLGITPEKSIKFIIKCAIINANTERVFMYAIMKTAPIVDVIITSCRPRLQWIKPNETDESMITANEFSVYLL